MKVTDKVVAKTASRKYWVSMGAKIIKEDGNLVFE
jgi:hypothetical protein